MVEDSGNLELTVERVLAVSWSFVWRSMVFSILVGAVMGLIGGGIVGGAGHSELGSAVGALLGWIASIPVSIVVLRQVLLKKFSTFSIKLVALRAEPDAISST
jgi:hypothetical protein